MIKSGVIVVTDESGVTYGHGQIWRHSLSWAVMLSSVVTKKPGTTHSHGRTWRRSLSWNDLASHSHLTCLASRAIHGHGRGFALFTVTKEPCFTHGHRNSHLGAWHLPEVPYGLTSLTDTDRPSVNHGHEKV